MRKGYGSKNLSFEKNAFLCHVWQTFASHVTYTAITGHNYAFVQEYMDRHNEPLPPLYRKYAQMMHTMLLSERGQNFWEKIALFSCQGRNCTFFVSIVELHTHEVLKV